MKTCTIDGCDKKHTARGLCSTHYNHQHSPNQHPKYAITCQTCGATHTTLRKDGRYCSLLCRDYARHGGPLSCPIRPPRPTPQPKPEPFRPIPRDCKWCGEVFTATVKRAAFCSRKCSNKAAKVRRRGLEAGSPTSYTWTEVTRLFLLLGRRCAYCECVVDGQPDPDHVVPLSRGGSNSITNILPCCRPCNSDKRDLLLHEWNADRARRHLPPVTTSWSVTDRRVQHLTCLVPAA